MAAPLDLYLLTFNCARTLIDPALLGTHLFNAWPRDRRSVPDIVAVALQEVAPIAYSFLGRSYITPYLDRVDESVQFAARKKLERNRNPQDGDVGKAYERLAVHSVGMTVTMVFVRKEIRDRITSVETAGVGVGVWEMGNKGGVGIRLSIDGRELTFVGMHLAPMEEMVIRRNQDWENICRGLVFEKENPREDGFGEREPLLADNKNQAATGLFKTNNHIFLFGDLNYRTSHVPPQPQTYKTYPQPSSSSPGKKVERIALTDLLTKDQLTQERLANRTLHGFAEQPIEFAPTYKYWHEKTDTPGPTADRADSGDDTDTDEDVEMIVREPSRWSWARHRWPSWCDRILFYPPLDLTPGTYTSLPLLPTSDHRGVVLHVTLKPASGDEFPGEDLRVKPPFPLDPHWRARRAAARRYEVVVGIASWVVLTPEGNATLAGLLSVALAIYFLVNVFGNGLA